MSEGRDFYREKVLAYQLGALDAEEARQIEALIGSDPAWKQAAEEARAMREGLEQARYGVLPPADLLARTQRHLQRGRQRGTRLVAAAAGLAATVLLALGVAWLLVSPARGSLIWRVEDRLFAGARVAPELVVCDPEDGSPIEGAHVEARLIDESRAVVPLGSGRTTAAGQVPGSWRVPDVAAGRFTLEVEARDDDGLLDRFASTVMVTPGVRLSVSTDRPAARPGEAMRARALCTRLDGGRPVADRPLTFELLDPSGTAIGRRHVQTSTYGLASASFPLDRELPEGRYVIRARVGDEEGERAFRLGMFRLPPYDVQIRLDRPLAAPGEPVAGQLRARTFDGHAIEGLEAVVRLGPKKVTVRLDDDGRGRFSLGAPSPGRHALSVRVRDAAGRTTEARRTVRVAGGRALFDLLPEAGELIPGLENRIYIVARRLDGSPLPGPVAIRGGAPVSLDEDGVGVLRHTPKRDVRSEFDLAAPDAPTDWQMFAPALREHNGGLLLRCARAVYESGDAIDVTLHSVHPEGRVLLSLQRDRRTVAVGVAELRDGRAQATLRVPRGVVGSVVVEATRLAPGETSVDRRFLVVRGDGGLRVDVRSDRAQYRPGGRALLSFRVFDAEGRGVPAALSVAGVDAALLALAGPNPGLVQALRAREQTALSRPDSAFDARDLRPADGATRRAQATIASLRFPTMRSTRAQLEELLPASFRESGLLEEVEEMFARNAAPHVQRRRAYFLEALEEQGHASTAAALRRLAQTGVGGPGQWVDQAPLARARAAERRSGLSQWLGLAFMTVSLLAMGWVLARDRGVMAGVGMASVAGASLLAAAVSAAIFDDVDVVGATMWAAVLVAQLGILLARPSRRSSSQIRIFTTFHLLAAFSVFGGEPVLLVPLAILVAVFQLGAESRGAWWVAPMVGTLLFLALGMCTVVLIPKGRERATLAESRNLARVTTQLLAEGERDETGASRPRRASRPPAEVRDDFRESLLFLPELVTDADGRAEVEVPLPDSLARWVVQADAITSDGGLADSEHTFVVTKPLTVDLYLPVAVTEGDLLAVQAVVRNTTDAAREVEVRLDRPEAEPQTVRVEPRGVRSVFWPIRFPKPGRERLTVRIDDDAVARTLQVVPHARPVPFGGARRVEGAGSLSYAVPASARRDVLRGSVRIERGPLAPVLEGLDAMLAEPHGCFEQTSSINYPNIMVLRYLDRHGRTDPALRARALDLLERGAQRLRRFESRGSGGFALYPGDAPSVWLTAYGLMQLRDMASVLDVDGALRERARAYLVRRGDRVRWTGEAAYVVLALGSDAPPAFVARLQSARAAIELEPYLCGLTALALLPHDAAEAKRLAARLRTFVEDDALVTGRTVSWGSGSVEATAVGALALLETGVDPALARRLVRKLVEASRPGGGWGSTHATVFALKALLAAERGGGDQPARASFTTKGATIALNDETPRVPLPFEPGPATLGVQVESGSAVVRVEGIAYVPWTDPLPASPLTFTIAYETKRARLGQPLRGVATLDGPTGGIDVPMIEWGLPAGFRPVRADLEAHVRKGALRRWEMAGRTLRLYLAPLEDGPRRLPVRFVPSAAGELRSAPSRAYPYYDRAQTAVTAPVRFTVQDRN